MFARKRFGQHFLHDRHAVRALIDAFAPRRSDAVVEIGPGHGALTFDLLDQVDQLHAIEVDRDLAAALEQRANNPALVIHRRDVLEVDFCTLGPAPLRLIGNLPYNISTPLLFHLLDQLGCIADMLFMFQKEVVDRLAAQPGTRRYGRLSVMVQQACRVECVMGLGPGAFTPPPKVDSAVARLTPRGDASQPQDLERFREVVKAAFGQRRKTLRNALAALISAQQFERAGIDPQLRAEALSPEDYVRLSDATPS